MLIFDVHKLKINNFFVINLCYFGLLMCLASDVLGVLSTSL